MAEEALDRRFDNPIAIGQLDEDVGQHVRSVGPPPTSLSRKAGKLMLQQLQVTSMNQRNQRNRGQSAYCARDGEGKRVGHTTSCNS